VKTVAVDKPKESVAMDISAIGLNADWQNFGNYIKKLTGGK